MGKIKRDILVLVCSATALVCGHAGFAGDSPGKRIQAALKDSIQHDSLELRKQQIYFQTPQALSTASTAFVSGQDIASVPVVSYPMALGGRLAGLNIIQSSGHPLSEGFSFSLRGQTPLIFIDGIPRSVTEIGMQEIESITVLKDAVATAMLGIRGSGGAIAITTKKGFTGKQQVNFNIQTGTSRSTDNLISKPLDSYRYAQLYNEALANDGLPAGTYGFSSEAISGFQSGSDPYKYPNVNWRDQVLKNSATVARYNIDTRGGNRFVKYFVSVEHFRQDGILQTSDVNKYNTNSDLKGYFARSNVDVQLTDALSAGIYIQGRILNTTSPGDEGTAGIFSSLVSTPSSAYPIYNPDGTYAGVPQFQNNILAQNISSGYSLNNTRTVLSDFYLKRTLDELTKGLWIKARASFFSNLSEGITRNKSFAVFERTGTASNGDPVYQQYKTNGVQANANGINFQNRSDFQELSLGYTRDFGIHGLDAVVLANRDNLVNGSNLPYTIQGISGHAAYNFNKKYLAEFSFAYNGANRYPDDGGFKYGFFPALGLGWNISEEDFLSSVDWLSHLKLYGSYGKTGQDNGAYFQYQQVYNASPSAYFGSSAGAAATVGESYLANPDITWEKAKKLNVGIDAAFLKNQLGFGIEYYANRFYDLSIVRGTNSGLLGISYPNENIGRERNSGWETQLSWQQNLKKIGYFIAFNASFQRSKLLYNAEASQRYDWMQRTGQPVGIQFGYVAEGLFQNQDEINSHASIEGYRAQPGDIRYRDLNEDGVINQYDQTAIGQKKPAVLLGTTLGFKAGSFDFSTLLQGRANRKIYLSGNSYWEFQNSGSGQAFENQLNRWTPETAATASYPRLSTGMGPRDGSVNNWVTSSYWLRDGNYLRVKTIELGYKIPSVYSKKVGLNMARLYVNALNPFTISSGDLNGADPENFSGSYPIQKVFNIGVNVQL
ncbi:SusC/RagA family TonB-linked outer membrane protein [Desertivirga xinjiangensis]|uniref:SusC/RagA family TonB-linked outer membrane protein n=1 Tax=Desertivirga xinjiangensis TaxID=539206 RepID=UPI00210A9330|nr:SusC/RagA family TonB-linked outer membrane protein [Pedobacter xinjiangensis]